MYCSSVSIFHMWFSGGPGVGYDQWPVGTCTFSGQQNGQQVLYDCTEQVRKLMASETWQLREISTQLYVVICQELLNLDIYGFLHTCVSTTRKCEKCSCRSILVQTQIIWYISTKCGLSNPQRMKNRNFDVPVTSSSTPKRFFICPTVP